jgi:hypothetical protein
MHESLVTYLYGEATPEESSLFEAHLSACAACRQEADGFERVRGMLQQWQLDDLPVVRVETMPARKRSMLEAIKELLLVMPVWAKAISVVAAAIVVLAALGTEVSIDGNGFRMRADLLRRGGAAPVAATLTADPNGAGIEQLRVELRAMVNTLIVDSERQQSEQFKAQMVSLESQLQNMRSTDLARLAETIQQQRARLRMIERDIDLREGYDLTDILFSELNIGSGERSPGRTRSGD